MWLSKTLVRSLYHGHGEKPADIAEKLWRHQSCICRILFKAMGKPAKPGRIFVFMTAPLASLVP